MDPVRFRLPAGLSPEGRREAERLMGRLAELREDGALWFYNDPTLNRRHAKQLVFHAAGSKVKAFLGGNQSGKSTGGLADNLIQALPREALPPHLHEFKRFEPPFRCRIAAPDFTSTMEGVIFEKLRELCPRSELLGGGWDSAYDKQMRRLRFKCGSYFDFLTYEQDLDKWGGATLDRVHFDEEPPGEKGRQMYIQARARVMARGGDILFTMTPEFGMSWMYDEVYELRDTDEVTLVQVATDENPFLPPGAVEEAFGGLSDEERAYKREGRFVAFGGLVVDLQDRHLVTTGQFGGEDGLIEHVKGLTTYRIIDPGSAQGAVSWVGFDKDDVMLVFDELYPKGREQNIPSVLAAQIKQKDAYYGIRPYELIDPSARNTTVDGGFGVEQAFFNEGLFPQRAKNDRFMSVMQLRRRVAADPAGLLIVRDRCPKTVWEANRWRVAEDETGDRTKRGRTGDTFATTGPDHLWDCIRYAAMEWVWGAERIDPIETYKFKLGEAPPASVLNKPDPVGMV